MFSYINKELPEVVNKYFHIDPQRQSIAGHSMGGLGALLSLFKNPEQYKSVSCFAPISNPSNTEWGRNAMNKLLGSVEAGKDWDPLLLLKDYTGPKIPLLIH